MQKYLSIMILPIGFTIFLYSDLITRLYLGPQWAEAAPLIGIWGLIHTFSLSINRVCGNVYVAINKPHIPVILSTLFAIVTIPTIIISSRYGLQTMFTARALTKLWLLSLHLVTIKILIHLSPFKIIGNILPELIGCGIMTVISYSLSSVCETIILQLASITVCWVAYFGFLGSIKNERMIIIKIWQHTTRSIVRRITRF